jgi:hypothetical protein
MTYNDMFILGPGTVAPSAPIVLYIPLNKAVIYPYIPLYTLILLFLKFIGASGASDARVLKNLVFMRVSRLARVSPRPRKVSPSAP